HVGSELVGQQVDRWRLAFRRATVPGHVELGPASAATGSASSPSCVAALAIATASIASDLPCSRAELRAPAVSSVRPHDLLAPREQEPLKRPADVAAVLYRSDPAPHPRVDRARSAIGDL